MPLVGSYLIQWIWSPLSRQELKLLQALNFALEDGQQCSSGNGDFQEENCCKNLKRAPRQKHKALGQLLWVRRRLIPGLLLQCKKKLAYGCGSLAHDLQLSKRLRQSVCVVWQHNQLARICKISVKRKRRICFFLIVGLCYFQENDRKMNRTANFIFSKINRKYTFLSLCQNCRFFVNMGNISKSLFGTIRFIDLLLLLLCEHKWVKS